MSKARAVGRLLALAALLSLACDKPPVDEDPAPTPPTKTSADQDKPSAPEPEPEPETQEAGALLVVEFTTEPQQTRFAKDIEALHEAAAKAGFEPPIVVEIEDPKPMKSFDGKTWETSPGVSRYELHVGKAVDDIYGLRNTRAFEAPSFENVLVSHDVLVVRGGKGKLAGAAKMAMLETDPALLKERLSKFDDQDDVAYLVAHLSGGNVMEQSVWMFGAGADKAIATLLADKSLPYPDGEPFLEIQGTVP